MKDNLLTVLTSQLGPRAVSSRAQDLFLPSWVWGSSDIRANTFFKTIIPCPSPTRGDTALARIRQRDRLQTLGQGMGRGSPTECREGAVGCAGVCPAGPREVTNDSCRGAPLGLTAEPLFPHLRLRVPVYSFS